MRNRRVSRVLSVGVSVLCAFAYACEFVEETSSDDWAGSNTQGSNTQGAQLQGSNTQGMSLLGFHFEGATKGGVALTNLRVEQGELVAELGAATQRGSALVNAQLLAHARNLTADPPTTATVTYKITGVEPEVAGYDPTSTGATFLYTIEQWVESTGSWELACPPDADGRRVAIPLAGTWNEQGARVESSTLFTFGCTSGVIAKCYRWGYRPWVTGYGDLVTVHQACTRAARADYCGDGVSHTVDGTLINIWDTLPAPGPIQSHGGVSESVPYPGMIFEAAWSADGAVCMNHERWITLESRLQPTCPGLAMSRCDVPLLARLGYPSAVLFNESFNVDPPESDVANDRRRR